MCAGGVKEGKGSNISVVTSSLRKRGGTESGRTADWQCLQGSPLNVCQQHSPVVGPTGCSCHHVTCLPTLLSGDIPNWKPSTVLWVLSELSLPGPGL